MWAVCNIWHRHLIWTIRGECLIDIWILYLRISDLTRGLIAWGTLFGATWIWTPIYTDRIFVERWHERLWIWIHSRSLILLLLWNHEAWALLIEVGIIVWIWWKLEVTIVLVHAQRHLNGRIRLLLLKQMHLILIYVAWPHGLSHYRERRCFHLLLYIEKLTSHLGLIGYVLFKWIALRESFVREEGTV